MVRWLVTCATEVGKSAVDAISFLKLHIFFLVKATYVF